MSRGTFPQTRKCSFCGRSVYDVDAVWESGQPYHEPCYKQSLTKQMALLEKKMQRGTLSIIEAKELMELKTLYEKERAADQNPNKPLVSHGMISGSPQFLGNTTFSKANFVNRLQVAKEKKALGDSQKNIKRIEPAQEEKS